MNQTSGLILVTTDGSPHSRRVLPHAAAFARTRSDRLVLLQVIDPAQDLAPEPNESHEAALARALAAATEDAAASLRNDGIEGRPLATALREGESVSRAVVRVASEQGATMLAMDTRGHGALHHTLHGSVALEVLAHTELPVLLTGAELADTPATEPYRVLITTDGSPASRDVIRALAPLLTPGRFTVLLLQVHERDSDAATEAAQVAEIETRLNAVRSFFAGGLDVQTRVREIARLGGIDTAIIEEARHLGACCIALSSHGTTAARHLFAGSTALQLLSRSPLPLIMARGAE